MLESQMCSNKNVVGNYVKKSGADKQEHLMNVITPPHPIQTPTDPESAKITRSCVTGANQHR